MRTMKITRGPAAAAAVLAATAACGAQAAPGAPPWEDIARGLHVTRETPGSAGQRDLTLEWVPNKPGEEYNVMLKDPAFPDHTFTFRRIGATTFTVEDLAPGTRYGFSVAGGRDTLDDRSNWTFYTTGHDP